MTAGIGKSRESATGGERYSQNERYRESSPTSHDEAVYHRYLDFGSLIRGGSVQPNWLPDGSCFWYERGRPNERQILKVDPAANPLHRCLMWCGCVALGARLVGT